VIGEFSLPAHRQHTYPLSFADAAKNDAGSESWIRDMTCQAVISTAAAYLAEAQSFSPVAPDLWG